jgi:Flp pilus assembly protein TadD
VSLIDEALAAGPGRHASSLLRTAAALHPLSEQPALAEARLAASGGRLQRESQAFESALRRNPLDWYAHFMLGIVSGLRHRPALARAELAHAHRLSPKDNLVHYAQLRQAAHEPMTQRQVAAILLYMSAPARGVRQR